MHCMKPLVAFFAATLFFFALLPVAAQEDVEVGAAQVVSYAPFLKNKTLGIVANQTSMVGDTHLVDTLLRMDAKIIRIFCPEHGFRGNADAGESVTNYIDPQTEIPVVSLYGERKKPTTAQLQGIDVMFFDLQDVGARFYTYISTLHYVMEACAQNGIPLVILDRPNPNGHYVDGPVLESAFKSFVGMHPVPVVHGMTIGEYAQMINGEGWLANGISCSLMVIPCKNYSHTVRYFLPVPPSPNLKSMMAIYLYPSTCFFEGTSFSLGRGTSDPFTMYGHPDFPDTAYSFVPQSMPGAKLPPLMGRTCYGVNLSLVDPESFFERPGLRLSYLLDAYNRTPDKARFFVPYFEKLAGTAQLRAQIKKGMSEEQIRETWEPKLSEFRELRSRYLIYRDFK